MTPPEVIEKLNREINAALADAKCRARLAELGATPFPGSPASYAKLVAEDTEKPRSSGRPASGWNNRHSANTAGEPGRYIGLCETESSRHLAIGLRGEVCCGSDARVMSPVPARSVHLRQRTVGRRDRTCRWIAGRCYLRYPTSSHIGVRLRGRPELISDFHVKPTRVGGSL